MNKHKNPDQVLACVTEDRRGTFQVIPLPPHPSQSYRVVKRPKHVKVGDVVSARLNRVYRGRAAASIEDVAVADTPLQLALNSLLRSFELPRTWSQEIKDLAIPKQVSDKSTQGRKDLRKVPLVTIDGHDAKDFDDAVYCERLSSGWRLIVAIADVAEYVEPESVIDIEARKRGTSVYLPQTVVPMLPEDLSNGICSLRPLEDRLAMVCDMVVNESGEVVSSEFSEAVICSHARLTYTEVARFLSKGVLATQFKEVKDSIQAMAELTEAQIACARERGSIDFNTTETRVALSNGEPQTVENVSSNRAHKMIEQAMVAANVEAARFLEKHNQYPLYRLHEAPSEFSVEELKHLLALQNITQSGPIEKPKQVQDLLHRLRQRVRDSQIWDLAVLMAMQQAYYGAEAKGHFGLALESYVHFTSPIRRYPDLIIHRQIKGVMNNKPLGLSKEEVESLGALASVCERRAVDLERAVEGWLKALIVQKRGNASFKGVISGVKEFGLFIELVRFGVSGLLHISDLDYEYYEFDVGTLTGDLSGKQYQFGDAMKVQVTEVLPPIARLNLKFEGSVSSKKRLRRR